MAGIHDIYLQGSVDGDRFVKFVQSCLLPVLNPFNFINPRSVVMLDNASIHHVDTVEHLIEGAGARVLYLPPYSSDLNPVDPVEGVFSQIKSMMKENNQLFETTSCTRTLLCSLFGMVTPADCKGHISHSGYF